ncbi:hypothetical protein [Enhygromyxa salina]|nr:hypothetical protein [Enhygromyxa salina]
MNNDLLGKLGILGVALVLSTPALNGCSSDGEEAGDGSGDTTGDGDGDTGDGDGDTGDGDGDTGDGDGDPGDGDGDGDGDPVDCSATHTPGDGAPDGDSCFTNEECASRLCEVFQDSPPVEGTCQPAPEGCETRIMGRVLNFGSREPIAGVDLRVAQAIQASTDPINAEALASGTSDADGEIDTLSDGQIASALGIVGLAGGDDDYFLTATGLASPADGINYGPANAIHDIWVVPTQLLDQWSDALMSDPEFEDHLPLGEAGGVVGLVRAADLGTPVPGAVVVPTSPDDSDAVIRYLNDAGDGFQDTMTSVHGIFVIVKPGLAETFDVELLDMPQGIAGTAGSANGAVFTLIMDVTP